MRSKIFLALIASTLSALILHGCVAAPKERAPEEIVKERAEKRWALMIEGRTESAYEYLTPAYRQITPFKQYSLKIKNTGIWEKALVDKVECEKETCKATVQIWTVIHHPLLQKPLRTQSYVTETWLKKEDYDTWYYKSNI